MANTAWCMTALLSPMLLVTATFSVATEQNLDFALQRIQPGWIVHLVVDGSPEQRHYCGLVAAKEFERETYYFSLSKVPERNRVFAEISCPRNSEASVVTIKSAELVAVDLLYQAADVYTMKEDQLLTFKHPIKKDAVSTDAAASPEVFETRVKSRPLVPGKYWPELSLYSGYSGFLGLGLASLNTQLSSHWFIHPRFASWSVRADLGYWARAQDTAALTVEPDRLIQTALGVSWRYVLTPKFLLHASLSLVSAFYRYFDETAQWAHRGALRAAITFEWAIWRANRDVHKLSVLVEPQYTQYLNKAPSVGDWTKQWGLMIGVRYGF